MIKRYLFLLLSMPFISISLGEKSERDLFHEKARGLTVPKFLLAKAFIINNILEEKKAKIQQ